MLTLHQLLRMQWSVVDMFGLGLAIGNRDPEIKQLKSGSSVCLSHGKRRSRWPELHIEMQALLLSLLCYVWCPIPKITMWSGWLLLICRSGRSLASKEEKSIKKESVYTGCFGGKISGSCLMKSCSLITAYSCCYI